MRTHFIPEIIRGIPVAYEDCKPYVEKSRSTLGEGRRHSCSVCRKDTSTDDSLVLLCPHESCQSTSHIACLSQKFLAEESNKDAFVPIQGTCPSCQSLIKWSDMMKELSLRMHGEEELKTMFKTKRKKKSDSTAEPDEEEFVDIDTFELESDEDLEETWMEDVKDDEGP
jgi:structure-specific endonuclease subunit SLX1